MTNGTTQGIFIVLAIVIFGIFVLISYMLYQDKMKTGLATIMCDAMTITSKNTGFELPDKDCTATFPNEEENEDSGNSEIPTGLQYYKIRDSNEERNESEVWVLIEHEQDNPNNVRIIDSGDRDGFTLETFGQDLDGIISFPNKIENWNITHIDKHSFEQARFSGIMKLPDELLVLDDYSLKQSVFTGEARFPENLEIIGIEALRDSMFSGGLDTLENVREIREDAFKESEFTDSDLSNLGKNADELVLADGSLGKYAPEGTFVPPSNIVSIGGSSSGSGGSGSGSGGSSGAFDSSGITGIDFSNVKDLKEIGDGAFKDAKITGELKLPKTVEAIGNNAFEQSELTRLDLAELVLLETIGDNAFKKSRLTGILTLPDSIKYIGDSAFYESMFRNENWVLPKKLEYIGDYAFYNSIMQGDLTTKENLTHIGDYAFYNSYKDVLTQGRVGINDSAKKQTVTKTYNLYLSDSIEYIGHSAFEKAVFSGGFTIPKNTKFIGDKALSNSFRTFALDRTFLRVDTINNIGYHIYVFYYTDQPEFKFNENIEYIGSNAFEKAQFKDTSEVIPRKLHTIGNDAFKYSFGTTSHELITRVGYPISRKFLSREYTEYNTQTIKVGRALNSHNLENVEIVD